VTLKWKAVTNAQGYEICGTNAKGTAVTWTKKTKNTEFRDKKAKEPNKKYYYKVRAYRKNSDGSIQYSSYSAVVNGKAVRQMYEKIYLSRTRTLTSHDKYRTTRTFSSNEALTAVGFGGGCYKFYDGTGSKKRLFYAHYTNVRSAKADYSKKQNYTTTTAENFANELTQAKVIDKGTGKGSRTYLVWVSTYTQHLYIFKWNKKEQKWKLFKLKTSNSNKKKWSHWECATGEAVSPTRIDMQMRIHKKIAYMIGIPYWNCFSGDNGIHGKRDSYVIDGKPHSHGCVRNYNWNAEWIYKNCKVGTQVIIY
jgi:lipoprotein-anchoring transpeptidase ErfK/SrfK